MIKFYCPKDFCTETIEEVIPNLYKTTRKENMEMFGNNPEVEERMWKSLISEAKISPNSIIKEDYIEFTWTSTKYYILIETIEELHAKIKNYSKRVLVEFPTKKHEGEIRTIY
jgi:uncharacterized protein YlzI (FlbEa/FlbD family)